MDMQVRGAARRVLAGVALLALLAVGAWLGGSGAPSRAAGQAAGAQVIRSVRNDVSPALRSRRANNGGAAAVRVPQAAPDRADDGPTGKDGTLQSALGALALPAPGAAWDGVAPGAWPADANGDVGPEQYVQVVNAAMQVWSKAGESLLGPLPLAQLWDGFGGPCASTGRAFDPVVLYDALADRWFLGAAYADTGTSPPVPAAGVCVAVSTSGDAAGTWFRYQFELSSSTPGVWYNLPRWAVWPDGYYMAAYAVSAGNQTPQPFVFDRLDMLAGQPAIVQQFTPPGGLRDILPVDFDGTALPERGAAGLFVEFPAQHDGVPATRLWRLHADWQTPANSSFTLATTLPVPSFQPLNCAATGCIPQPATARKLYTRPDLLLYRASYRKNNGQAALLFAHPASGDSGQAAIRWYQLSDPLGQPEVLQAGTYAPTGANRWAGSLAMDGSGNIALAYNAGSDDIYPSVRYAAQLAFEERGVLSTAEGALAVGAGAQRGTQWSDYSNLAVDPADSCTFWYSAPYLDDAAGAHTRIGSFRLPNCIAAAPPIPFKDVAADSYFDVPVYALFNMGAISGYADRGTCSGSPPCFLPFNNVSRGQAAKILALITNRLASPGNWTFQDVPPTNPFNLYVEGLARAGAISGYNCGGPGEECGPAQRPYFRLNSPLTRGQLVKIAALAASITAGSEGQLFADVAAGSPFYPYVQALASRGVINGYNCGGNDAEPCQAPANLPYFRPGNSITRGQAAKVIYLVSRGGINAPQPTPTPLLTATPTSTVVPDMWQATYYSERELLNVCGTEQFADINLRLVWNDGAPGTCPDAYFGARFTRTINVGEENILHFLIKHDDGVRLYVDGLLRLDHWNYDSTDIAEVRVGPGQHRIVVEYNQILGLASLTVEVSYLRPTATPTAIAPASTATPAPQATATPTPRSDFWTAQYFADTILGQQCDQELIAGLPLDLLWTDRPTNNCPADNFSARFERRVNLAGGPYQFELQHDDGGRLFVDGQLLIDNWATSGTSNAAITLNGGEHDIRAEMNEFGADAAIHLHWTFAPTPIPTPPADVWAARYSLNYNPDTLCTQQVISTTFLDLTWGTNAATPDCPDGRHRAQFDSSRDLEAGVYTFSAQYSGVLLMQVDGQVIINQTIFNDHNDTIVTTLNSGTHQIHVDYGTSDQTARIKLSWSRSDPLPAPSATASAPSDHWVSDYYSDREFGTPCAHEEIFDTFIDRHWEREGPPGCPVDNFSARFERQLYFEPGSYVFHAYHDDGVRIYLNGNLALDRWAFGPTDENTVYLDGGIYDVKVEYDEEMIDAFIHVSWWHAY